MVGSTDEFVLRPQRSYASWHPLWKRCVAVACVAYPQCSWSSCRRAGLSPSFPVAQVILALNGMNPYDVARNGPAAAGTAGAAFPQGAQPAGSQAESAGTAAAPSPLERPAAPPPALNPSPPVVPLHPVLSPDCVTAYKLFALHR